jgi:hypothetical protein
MLRAAALPHLQVLVMRSIGTAIMLLAVGVSPARADRPIVINADLGIHMPIAGDPPLTCYPDHDSKYRPVLNFDIAYRFIEQVAAGIHLGIRRYPWEQCGGNIPGAYQEYRGLDTALEFGVGAQWSMDRFWLSSWVGVQQEDKDVGVLGGRHLAYALSAGVDVYIDPTGHRIGMYLDLTNADGGERIDERNLSAGIAYRYW